MHKCSLKSTVPNLQIWPHKKKQGWQSDSHTCQSCSPLGRQGLGKFQLTKCTQTVLKFSLLKTTSAILVSGHLYCASAILRQ